MSEQFLPNRHFCKVLILLALLYFRPLLATRAHLTKKTIKSSHKISNSSEFTPTPVIPQKTTEKVRKTSERLERRTLGRVNFKLIRVFGYLEECLNGILPHTQVIRTLCAGEFRGDPERLGWDLVGKLRAILEALNICLAKIKDCGRAPTPSGLPGGRAPSVVSDTLKRTQLMKIDAHYYFSMNRETSAKYYSKSCAKLELAVFSSLPSATDSALSVRFVIVSISSSAHLSQSPVTNSSNFLLFNRYFVPNHGMLGKHHHRLRWRSGKCVQWLRSTIRHHPRVLQSAIWLCRHASNPRCQQQLLFIRSLPLAFHMSPLINHSEHSSGLVFIYHFGSCIFF